MTETASYTLIGYGPSGWGLTQQVTQGLTSAWADYEGFHVGSCPTEPPPYSHLWAWNGDASLLVRVRVDFPDAVVGILLRSDGPTDAVPDDSLLNEPVEVAVRDVSTWDPEDGRVGAQPSNVLPGRIRTVEVIGPFPVVFVAGPIGVPTAAAAVVDGGSADA